MVAELGEISRSISCYALKDATVAMAMAVQQQQVQNQQGDLAMLAAAMTPGPNQGQPMALRGVEHKMSGQTPCAKRPVTQSTIAVAAGGHKPMNMEDLVRDSIMWPICESGMRSGPSTLPKLSSGTLRFSTR